MARLRALTREVSPALASCELTQHQREPIDVNRARLQHEAYERALEELGCKVERLPADATMPDSVFIEDTAVVFDEVAVVTRPGAASRRAETDAVAEALARYRPIVQIVEPATLDGGDVLVLGRKVFVGRSRRSNPAAVEQLSAALAPFGYKVKAASVLGGLHLKGAVTSLGGGALLINRRWAVPRDFDGFELVDVDASEQGGANIVEVDGRLLYSDAFPRTRELLELRGFEVIALDASELAKAEGALTCCSLLMGFRTKY